MQEVTINATGVGESTYFGEYAKALGCTQVIYEKCSGEGEHTFENPATVWDCYYWEHPNDGTPPQMTTVNVACESPGEGFPTGQLPGNPWDYTGGPTTGNDNPNGGGYTAPNSFPPPGQAGAPNIALGECVQGLDCEDCRMTYDFNRDCGLNEDESGFYALVSGIEGIDDLGLFYYANFDLLEEAFSYWSNDGDDDFTVLAIDAGLTGGEADYLNKVILDSTFTNSKTKCIHDKMKSNTNNIYSKMLDHFNSSTQKFITFSIGNLSVADWGITNGNLQTSNDYNIIINTDVVENNGSNLMKYVTLCHELIHAYMFDSLEDAGVITFDSTGSPILNVNCPSNNINLNNQSVKDRFVSLICAMNSAGTLTQDWSHDLFNSNVFNVQDYRQELENLILNDYDWNSESQVFINNASTTFGTNWKQELAKAISWIGLENTNGYTNYLNTYSTQPIKFLYINDIRNKISNTNNNCP